MVPPPHTHTPPPPPHPTPQSGEWGGGGGRAEQSHSIFCGGTEDVAVGFWGRTHAHQAGAAAAGGVPPSPCVSGRWRIVKALVINERLSLRVLGAANKAWAMIWAAAGR
jgi:hypothetical protein